MTELLEIRATRHLLALTLAAFAVGTPTGCSCTPPVDAGPGDGDTGDGDGDGDGDIGDGDGDGDGDIGDGDGDGDGDIGDGDGDGDGDTEEVLVVPATATACEVLLIETGGALTVDFGAGTQGTSIREAPKTAVAARSASAPDIRVTGAYTVKTSRCVDGTGAEVGTVTAPPSP